MNIPMFQAYIYGYQEYLFDMQCLSVHHGYWAGYYQSKKPKSVNYILDKMIREHQKITTRKKSYDVNIIKPDVDIDHFMELEAKRMKYLSMNQRR